MVSDGLLIIPQASANIKPMAKESLRFGITDGKGYWAAAWKLFTQTGGDRSHVYLVNRALGKDVKISLHDCKHYNWRVAFEKPFFENRVKDVIPWIKERAFQKWHRPESRPPGFTVALRITTPSFGINNLKKGHETERITAIPNAPDGMATEIAIVFTTPLVRGEGYPGQSANSTSLIGKLSLPSGETVWAVYRAVVMPDFSHFLRNGRVGFFTGQCPVLLDEKSGCQS